MNQILDITTEELPIFLAEADEQFQILDEGLVRLEREHQDSALLQALFRAAHTLKGSAGMIGFRRMVELTHSLEAVLDGLRKGSVQVSPGLIDACLQAVDALRMLCQEITSSEAQVVDIQALVERLKALNVSETQIHQQNPLQAAEQAEILASANGKRRPIHIRARISPDSVASAARAFQLLLALQELGEIIQIIPTREQIETAAPVSIFEAQFIPACQAVDEAALAELRNSLSSISDIEDLFIEGDEVLQPEPGPDKPQPAAADSSPLGEALLQSGTISAAQLQAAIQLQQGATGPTPLLGQVLIQIGAITQEVLDQAIAEQKEKGTAASGGESQERARSRAAERTVRTSVERLDNMMNLVGELITDRNRLNLIRGTLESQFHGNEGIDALAGTILHIGRITDQLQAEVMGIRMLPISNVFNKFPRMVRDLCRKAGKQIDLVIRGEDTELDRTVIEVISDPIIHLLRNSVDHGIEPPAERIAAGKPERGIILLTARHEQGRIIVTVEDNGRGINVEAVKAKAIEKDLISPVEAANMADEEAIELIFLSGLSTARTVSDVSGRGVGMDIVRSNIERLNGNILVESWPGRGSQFQIVLPLTLAIVPTLLVRVGVSTYAIPLVTVSETLRVPVKDIQTINGRPVILIREHILPIIRLAEVFNLPLPEGDKASETYEYIVIVRSGKSQVGLIVDALVGEEEVVVKSLSSVIGEVTGISSAAILGDGQIALIIDVQSLFRLAAQPSAHFQRH